MFLHVECMWTFSLPSNYAVCTICYINIQLPKCLFSQVHSLKLALEGVEKERDFYFGKLREIELLCQEHGEENNGLVQRLMEVLYASEEHVSLHHLFFSLHKSINNVALMELNNIHIQGLPVLALYASYSTMVLAKAQNFFVEIIVHKRIMNILYNKKNLEATD